MQHSRRSDNYWLQTRRRVAKLPPERWTTEAFRRLFFDAQAHIPRRRQSILRVDLAGSNGGTKNETTRQRRPAGEGQRENGPSHHGEKSTGVRPEEHGSGGETAGRFLHLRQRRLAEDESHSARRIALGQFQHSGREKYRSAPGRSRESREDEGRRHHGSRGPEGGRLLYQRYGRESDRCGQGQTARGGIQEDRRDQRPGRSPQGHRTSPQNGCDRIFRFHLRPGRQEQHDGDLAGLPGWSRHAGPRLLHEGRRRFEEIA